MAEKAHGGRAISGPLDDTNFLGRGSTENDTGRCSTVGLPRSSGFGDGEAPDGFYRPEGVREEANIGAVAKTFRKV